MLLAYPKSEQKSFQTKDFQFLQQIGAGKFGVVYKAIHIESRQQVAIKIIAKKKMETQILFQRLKSQIQIHCRLKHQYICEMYCYFTDKNCMYLVMEFCKNGSLSYPIKNKKQKLTEKKIASILQQLLIAVLYLEERNVIHRDIKLQNILLDQNYNIKLSDFGWSVHTFNQRNTFCGTMEYICPQMIKNQVYDQKVDIYCLGIILYELFYVKSPFQDQSQSGTLKNIKQGIILFDDDLRKIPESAKQLICQMLQQSKEKRPLAQEALNHQFFKQFQQIEQNYKEIII